MVLLLHKHNKSNKFEHIYSNSLIIRQVKTKEINTVTGVWIPILYLFLRFLFNSFFRLKRYIKHQRQCFIGYPNTSNFIKSTPRRVIFSTLFSVFGYPDKHCHLCSVYYFKYEEQCYSRIALAFTRSRLKQINIVNCMNACGIRCN